MISALTHVMCVLVICATNGQIFQPYYLILGTGPVQQHTIMGWMLMLCLLGIFGSAIDALCCDDPKEAMLR